MNLNVLNEISPSKKKLNHFNTLYGSQKSILNEIKNKDYNIRIIESPSQNKSFKISNETGSKTFYKQNNKDEEDKFEIGEVRRTDISSEEFFMRRSQINYIKKNLSPVKAITLTNNANYINSNINNGSLKRIFSARINNYANLIKSDLILIWNIIQKNSNIINFYKHLFQNDIDNSCKNNRIMNRSELNTSKGSIVGKMSLKNIMIQRRCLEIESENRENFSEILEKINDNSKNIDLLMNNYKCLVKDELIYKMALENHLNQLLIKKIDDLFFIMNIKNLNENNEFTIAYSDTHSKMQNINQYIELMKKLILNKTNIKNLIATPQQNSSRSSIESKLKANDFLNNKLSDNDLNKRENHYKKCIYNCEYCQKISQADDEDYGNEVVLSSNSIKEIPEVNELNETYNNSKNYSKRNSVINSKNNTIKINKEPSVSHEKIKNDFQLDLMKMHSSFDNNDQDLGNEDYDSNKILDMKTFSEFKNYETENVILNHLKKLHDNTNEKIFKIFYEYFLSKYPDENDKKEFLNENSLINKNIQRAKTKLRGMLMKKNDDGIMSFLFIREEFEKIIKEKEDIIDKLSYTNTQIEQKMKIFEKNSIYMEKQINEIQEQLNKKEAEIKIEFLQSLESENKKYIQHVTNKLQNRMESLESENAKLHLDIDVLNSKIKSIDREKQDLTVKLEYFIYSEERRKKKKKMNESYEDVLIEQFDNMKKAYQDELEKLKKEIIQVKFNQKKIINKLEMENEEIRNRNLVYYKQLEDLKLKLF